MVCRVSTYARGHRVNGAQFVHLNYAVPRPHAFSVGTSRVLIKVSAHGPRNMLTLTATRLRRGKIVIVRVIPTPATLRQGKYTNFRCLNVHTLRRIKRFYRVNGFFRLVL